MAPTVYMEQLIYDVRLMNSSIERGSRDELRSLYCESDMYLDPQALILEPEDVITISREIVTSSTHVEAAVKASLKALGIIEEAVKSGKLLLEDRETVWIDMIRGELSAIPYDESEFVALVQPSLDLTKTTLSEYGL